MVIVASSTCSLSLMVSTVANTVDAPRLPLEQSIYECDHHHSKWRSKHSWRRKHDVSSHEGEELSCVVHRGRQIFLLRVKHFQIHQHWSNCLLHSCYFLGSQHQLMCPMPRSCLHLLVTHTEPEYVDDRRSAIGLTSLCLTTCLPMFGQHGIGTASADFDHLLSLAPLFTASSASRRLLRQCCHWWCHFLCTCSRLRRICITLLTVSLIHVCSQSILPPASVPTLVHSSFISDQTRFTSSLHTAVVNSVLVMFPGYLPILKNRYSVC